MADAAYSEYCREQFCRLDPDRYLCALLAPGATRPAIFALYAFNLEIARVRELAREPKAGEIRLAWWHEAIEDAYAGRVRHHAVAEPLARAIARYRPRRSWFEALIEARALDLTEAAPATLEDLERYAEATSGGLQLLSLDFLGVQSAAADEAARRVGIARALLGLSRAVPFHASAGCMYLPCDLAAQEGLALHDLASGQGSDALRRVVKIVVERAGDHLAAARAAPDVPHEALPALWPAWLADLYRSRLARAGHDPFSDRLDAAPLRKQFRVLSGALTGRY